MELRKEVKMWDLLNKKRGKNVEQFRIAAGGRS